MGQGTKDKLFSIRIPEKLLNEYRKFCTDNSINMSGRIRKFMERDIDMWRQKQRANLDVNKKS